MAVIGNVDFVGFSGSVIGNAQGILAHIGFSSFMKACEQRGGDAPRRRASPRSLSEQ
jgi:hypothetical protein